jgi:hypothetical protein
VEGQKKRGNRGRGATQGGHSNAHDRKSLQIGDNTKMHVDIENLPVIDITSTNIEPLTTIGVEPLQTESTGGLAATHSVGDCIDSNLLNPRHVRHRMVMPDLFLPMLTRSKKVARLLLGPSSVHLESAVVAPLVPNVSIHDEHIDAEDNNFYKEVAPELSYSLGPLGEYGGDAWFSAWKAAGPPSTPYVPPTFSTAATGVYAASFGPWHEKRRGMDVRVSAEHV